MMGGNHNNNKNSIFGGNNRNRGGLFGPQNNQSQRRSNTFFGGHNGPQRPSAIYGCVVAALPFALAATLITGALIRNEGGHR